MNVSCLTHFLPPVAGQECLQSDRTCCQIMEQWSRQASFPPRAAGELLWGPAVPRSPNSFSGSRDLKQVPQPPYWSPLAKSAHSSVCPSIHQTTHPSTHLFSPPIQLFIHPAISFACPPVHVRVHPSIHPFTYSSTPCPSTHLPVHHPIHPSTRPHIHTHLSIYLSVHPPTHPLSIYSSIHPSTHLFICSASQLRACPPLHLCVQPSTHPSVHLSSVHPPTHPPTRPFIDPPIHP